MKPILFATNYSSSAENAGDYAAQLAKLCEAPLIVLHSWTLPVLSPEDVVMVPPAEAFHERERLAIDKEVMRLRTRWGISVTGVECQGYTPDEIENLYRQQEVSLVVMGMHHHNFCSRLLGSVATRSIHNAGYPVLLVPDTARFNTPAKILLAADKDFTTTSQSLNPLKLFVRKMNTALDIVHVSDLNEVWNVSESESSVNLEYLLREIPHQWNITHDNDVSEAILRTADNAKADWIAVAPRHFNWLETQLKRSISENLAFSTNKPLLILPSDNPVAHDPKQNPTIKNTI